MKINGNLKVGQSLSGRSMTITSTPSTNNSSTNILVRNSTTGNLEQRTIQLQTQSAVLDNWAAYAQNGLVAWISAGSWSGRTLTAPAAGLSISNANGVAGNPTFALANDLSALEGLAGTGFAVRTGTDTWAQRSLTGGTGIQIINGTGTSAANVAIRIDNATYSQITASTLVQSLWTGSTTADNKVGGGENSNVSGSLSTNSLLFGGTFADGENRASGPNCVVIGGFNNSIINAASSSSSIIGGFNNSNGPTAASANTITGGISNTIASGSGSTIAGGQLNSISTNAAVILGGRNNRITASQSAIIGGNTNTVSGSSSVAMGSNHAMASALSLAVGDSHRPVANALASASFGTNTRATSYAEIAIGSGNVNGLNAQNGFHTLNVSTTNATQTSVLDGAGNAGLELEAGYSYFFTIKLQATIVSATNQGGTRVWEYKVKAKNVGGTSTATVVSTGLFSDTGDTGTGAFALTQNTITSNRLQIRVTGAASTTVTWQAFVEYTKVRFNTNA